MTRLDLLGSGNAFLPSGRHHSFLCIDQHMIIDIPPTALASLRRAKISPADIDFIFVTHVHGDHVFGFPFLLLERKYISDREGIRPLTVAGEKGVQERLRTLCELAYPGSLTEQLDRINWVDCPEIKGWEFERFEVLHDPEVEPNGWLFKTPSGMSFLHSGDSGPCESLSLRLPRADFVIIEMGIPDYVESEHHHKPSDICRIAQENPHVQFLVTHTYIDADYEILTTEIPVFPSNVIHGEDELTFNL